MKQTIQTKFLNQVMVDKEDTKNKWDPYTEDEVDHQTSSKWVPRFHCFHEAWFDMLRNKHRLEVLNVIRSAYPNTMKSMK